MDDWRTDRLKRDLTVIAAGVLGAAGLVGAAIGWVGHQLFQHLHHPTPSEHFRGKR